MAVGFGAVYCTVEVDGNDNDGGMEDKGGG